MVYQIRSCLRPKTETETPRLRRYLLHRRSICRSAGPFRSMASNITCGEPWIRMAKWSMCIFSRSAMGLLRSDSSGDCSDHTVANRGRSSRTSYAVTVLPIGSWYLRRSTALNSMRTTEPSNHMRRPGCGSEGCVVRHPGSSNPSCKLSVSWVPMLRLVICSISGGT